ncbi:MAG TPA: SDR family oxidoreductase [Longimicrobium sp.]|nr:SDR family oxidoreductase [Longimicrobium sp.]
MRYVVTGTNRGIGLELTRQLLARGETVVATARHPEQAPELQALRATHPDRLTVLACDTTDEGGLRALAAAVGDGPVDVLINNAGMSGSKGPIDELDLDAVRTQFEVNALGTLRVILALLPAVRRGGGRKIINISTERASLHNNTSGGRYPYRMSKVALNMATRSLAADLRPEGISCLMLHPGWVQTRMGGPDAPVPVSESVSGMLRLIDGLSLDGSGRFLDYQGHEVPW